MNETVFGARYRATEKIGSGGMAEVYKAVDEVLGRTVAVKVMHRRYAADPTFVARFRQEAQAAANLSSPNIVNIYDWGQQDDTYYIAMEYVRGLDLKSLVEQHGSVEPDKAAEYAAQVCSALAVAHGYGIIHRDIKPQNLILTGDGTVKVTDFGIARAGNTNMTQTGSVLGTAYYLSPEQAQGRPLSPASDLYSLGIVLYELVTGKLPFVGDTPVATALKQVNEAPVPPRNIEPKVPASLEAIILKTMRKDPAERYQTADEMRADLRRFTSGQPVLAAAGLAGAAAAAGAGVAAAAGMDSTTVMGRVPGSAGAGGTHRAAARRPSAPPAEPPKRRSWTWMWVLLVIAALALLGGLALAFGGSALFQPAIPAPKVVGLQQQAAQSVITSAGLVAQVTTQTSDFAVGRVITQNPVADTPLHAGDTIQLTVSAGPATAQVPDLTGKTDGDAARAIAAAGFAVGPALKSRYDGSVPSGSVIEQNPPAGTMAAKGSAVSYRLSRGKQTATVPDVQGLLKGSARSKIRAAGFLTVYTEAYSTGVSKDRVIGTNPDAGSTLALGETVRIIVSLGPQTVTIPNLVGQKQADAQATLTGLGLASTVTTAPALPAGDGYVISTNPHAGVKVPKGSGVSLTVGEAPPGP